MTFQAYLDNIERQTGKTPEGFRALAQRNGLLREGLKAGELVAWIKRDFDLGHGHAMAVWAAFTRSGWVPAARPSPAKRAGGKR
jgi:hypothetical protein